MSSRDFETFSRLFQPMLVSPGQLQTIPQDWLCEPKLDGMRAIAFISQGNCKLLSRHGLEHTFRFPHVQKELASLKGNLILDGELICLDERGKPCFDLLRDRFLMSTPFEVQAAERKHPGHFFGFDIVYKDGEVIGQTYLERKEILVNTVNKGEFVNLVRAFEGDAAAIFNVCLENSLEGIVAKNPSSTYKPGIRSSSWMKVKQNDSDSFVIGGHTEKHGFLIGQFNESGQFVHCGVLEAGFRNVDLDHVFAVVKEVKVSPFVNLTRARARWFEPTVVVDLRFMRWTTRGQIREGVFLRFREDLHPQEVLFTWSCPN